MKALLTIINIKFINILLIFLKKSNNCKTYTTYSYISVKKIKKPKFREKKRISKNRLKCEREDERQKRSFKS